MEVPIFIRLNILFIPLVILLLILLFLIRKYSRRITEVSQLPRKFKGLTLKCLVISCGDGDGCRVVHMPLLRWSNRPTGDFLRIRLAAIDAPEMRCFDRPAQSFSKEAKDHLSFLIKNKIVKITILDIDRYGRIVGMIYVTQKLRWKNVNLELIKRGLACVFRSKITSFGRLEEKFFEEENRARKNKIGIWGDPNFVLPQKYKKQTK